MSVCVYLIELCRVYMRRTQTLPDQPEMFPSPDLQEAGDCGVEAAAFLNVLVSVYGANY